MRNRILGAAALFIGVASFANAETKPVQPDNSAVNKPREEANAIVADDASSKKTDVELTAAIRKALVDEKDLSTYAKNVKIIVKDHAVHLAGPVRTDAEKKAVEQIAATQAGTANVTSELSVAPK